MGARAAFFDGLATMLEAGIPIRTALDHIAARSGGGGFGRIVLHLRDAAQGGRPLADAMEERPAEFRRFEVELVRAAETSGTLERAARALAANEEAAERIRRKLLAGLAYPAAVVHFAAVPLNIGLLVGGRPLSFLIGLLAWWIPLWILCGAGWLLLRKARSGGPAARVVLGIPLLGGMLRDAALVRWARVFAALEDAGVGPEPCALRAAGATGFASLEEPLAAPAARLRAGASRADAFAGAPLPGEFYRALAQGEVAGSIAPSLARAADAHELRLTTRIDASLALAPVVATILAGAVVLYVAMSVVGGYYGIK